MPPQKTELYFFLESSRIREIHPFTLTSEKPETKKTPTHSECEFCLDTSAWD